MTATAALLAALIGCTLGALGGGGAILTVPVFVYALHIPLDSAAPMSLLVIGAAATGGALQRLRAREFSPRRGVAFGIAAVAGAFVGARVAVFIPAQIRLIVFAVIMLVAAALMWQSAYALEVHRRDHPRWLTLATPMGIGALTGIIGIGGGFLFVPAMVTLLRVPIREATGLSLMVIAMNTLAGFAGYLGRVDIDWGLALPFAGIVVASTLISGPLAYKIEGGTLKRVFAVLLIAVGAFVLYENLP